MSKKEKDIVCKGFVFISAICILSNPSIWICFPITFGVYIFQFAIAGYEEIYCKDMRVNGNGQNNEYMRIPT